MEEKRVSILYFIKLPFIFLFYAVYMILSIFIPVKTLSRIMNIEVIEKELNSFFNNSLILKLIALVLALITLLYFY